MEKYFLHSGDLGDIIYALPAMKALGGGTLILEHKVGVREPMTHAKHKMLRELLITQSYVKDVLYKKIPRNLSVDYQVVDFDFFRDFLTCGFSLAEAHLNLVKQSTKILKEPWLQLPPNRMSPVIINRTERYHNNNFPWNYFIEKYPYTAAFVGLPHEFKRFKQLTGCQVYCATPDYLSLARVIAGCDLFIGNQSFALALALGLGIKCVIEEYKGAANCRFTRYRTNVDYI